MFTDVSTVFGFECLIVTVNGFVHQLDQFTAGIFLQQFIPAAAPHDFDYLPAGTCEHTFHFVNDFTVTVYRAVKTLQVTVDNEDQVVQAFADSDIDCTFRFRLIHLAITQEGINGLLRSVFQTTVFQIFQELSLIDSCQRPQTHRNGRELPEVRHQFRVRIRRQTFAADFLTEIVQLLFGQTTFHECACVVARA